MKRAASHGNPDRASRSAAVVPLATPVVAPAAVTSSNSITEVRTDDEVHTTPSNGEGGCGNSKVVLRAPELTECGAKKRKSFVDRRSPEWSCIQITSCANTTTPVGICIYCGKSASWTVSRIKDHIMGNNGAKACPAESEAFFEMKEQISSKRVAHEAEKQKKLLCQSSNEAAIKMVKPSSAPVVKGQLSIEQSMSVATSNVIDEAIARLVYAENLSFTITASNHFKHLLWVMRTAPASYKPPHRNRLSGDLLDTTVRQLRAADAPLREEILQRHGCTVLCDGWDDIAKNHLVNLLYGTAAASFFEGTTQLTADMHENADSVANFIIEAIDRLSPPACVMHVVTDTCSTMKAAWRVVEKKRPWVTTTCCAPHVLSLLLKDIASIPEVATVMAKMELILHRFWGRTRWPRTKLKELTQQNHGRTLGLYRAKVTRFAGKVRISKLTTVLLANEPYMLCMLPLPAV